MRMSCLGRVFILAQTLRKQHIQHNSSLAQLKQKQKQKQKLYSNMFKFIIVTLAFASAYALPNQYDAVAETRSFKNDLKEDGSYSYQYETTNGIGAQEAGIGGVYASGSAAYYAPDGQLIQLTYTADENGFQPQGQHLPTPPPIPAAILKSLEYIRTHPNQEEQRVQQQRPQFQQQRYRPVKF